jgi:hypothetical protein
VPFWLAYCWVEWLTVWVPLKAGAPGAALSVPEDVWVALPATVSVSALAGWRWKAKEASRYLFHFRAYILPINNFKSGQFTPPNSARPNSMAF